jgi:hypothetical protein
VPRLLPKRVTLQIERRPGLPCGLAPLRASLGAPLRSRRRKVLAEPSAVEQLKIVLLFELTIRVCG